MMRKGNAGGANAGGVTSTGGTGRRTMRNSLRVNLGDILKPNEN